MSLGLGLFTSIIGYWFKFKICQGFPYDYLYTFFYLVMFIAGALIAKYRQGIVNAFRKFSGTIKVLLFVCGVLMYISRFWLFNLNSMVQKHVYSNWVVTIAVVLFIILSLSSTQVARFLNWRPIVYVGKISYSIYLYHAIVLIAMVCILYDRVPLTVIWCISACVAVIVASISYRYVEKPSIKYGREIAAKIDLISMCQV